MLRTLVGRRLWAALLLVACAPAMLQAANAPSQEPERLAEGALKKRAKALRGEWWIEARAKAPVLVFGDDFEARSGPDLKVFLSPQSYSSTTGRNATEAALYLGELKGIRGRQEYRLPADADLEKYGSVLVHCERYAVLWGGDDLR